MDKRAAPAPRETPIDVPSVLGRLGQAVRYVVGSVKPDTWMTPGQPLAPIAPESKGRAWDYPVAINTDYKPRGKETLDYPDLRALAVSYDPLTSVIETRKDQMCGVKWAIKARDPKVKIAEDPRIEELQKLFNMPDGVNSWQKWLRVVIHELLVTDAVTIYPRKTRGGGLFALELMDGATIKRVIDDTGRTPLPPDPAYQQILKGVPASDYTFDELIYAPRNTRVHKLYGFSPVEQVAMTVNLAIRREIHRLQYYTEGNLPDLLVSVPAEWSAEQLETLARFWEARLNGNTSTRRQAMFVPDGAKPFDIKEKALTDPIDEWLVRVVCAAFSISPQAYTQMVNRGNQESMHEAAIAEGLMPVKQWLQDLMNIVIWKYKGYEDLEFGWEDVPAQDPLDLAKIQDQKIRSGVISIDEARLDDGLEPIGMKNAFMTPTGPMMLAPYINGTVDGQPPPPPQQVVPGEAKPGKPGPDGKPGAPIPGKPTVLAPPKKPTPKAPDLSTTKPPPKSVPAIKFEKLAATVSSDRPALKKARAAMARDVRFILYNSAPFVAKELATALGLSKAEDDMSRVDAALASVNLNWTIGPEPLEEGYVDAAGAAVEVMIGKDGMSQMIEKLNQNAKDWAQKRAAELVGKQVLDDGTVVDNPNPQWSITESTRDMLRETVTRAYDEGWTPDALAREIEDSYAFSNDRADMIARTELKMANSEGQMDGYAATGLELKKKWLLSDDHDIDDECNAAADDGWIDFDDTFSNGDDAPPNHPNCFPGGTLVSAVGEVTGGTRRWYEGELSSIRTASGKLLSPTINHPILTTRGWVAAGLIVEGDRVISRVAEQGLGFNDDDQDVPALINKVFGSLLESGDVRTRVMPGATEDFHGDGTNCEVHVVLTNRPLRNAALKASHFDHALEHTLVDRLLPCALDTGRPREQERVALLDAADSSVSGVEVAKALFRGRVGVSDDTGLSVTSKRDPGLFENAKDRRARDTQLFAEITRGSTGAVFADEVIEVERLQFAGHVFNLETVQGHYTANGVVAHNCNCSITVMTADAADDTEE